MRISLTGAIDVGGDRAGVAAVRVRGSQSHACLALLVLERHRPIRRDELAELLWPDCPLPDAWLTALRGVVGKVRAALVVAGADANVITTAGGRYHVRLPDTAEVDVERAARDLAEARAASATGDLPTAIALAASAAEVARRSFLTELEGDWALQHRNGLHRLHIAALEVLARAQLDRTAPTDAVTTGERLLAAEPLSEIAYRLLLEAHGALNDPAAATRTLRRCEAALTEIGASPSPATVETWRRAVAQRDVEDPLDRAAVGGVQWRTLGDRAMAEGDYNAATRHYRRLADASGDGWGRGQALVDLGTALRRAGRGGEAEKVLLAAADIARRGQHGELLGRAALALTDHQRLASHANPTRRRLLEEALEAVPEVGALHGRLLAGLAEQLAVDGDVDAVEPRLRRVTALARADSSGALGAEVLAARVAGLGGPQHAAERLGLTAELEGRTAEVTASPLHAVATEHRIHALVELGEWAAAVRAMEEYRHHAEVTGIAYSRWMARQHAVCRAVAEGRLSEVDDLLRTTMEPGRMAVGDRVAAAAAIMHLHLPRWMTGRLDELAHAVREIGEWLGWPLRSRAGFAWVLSTVPGAEQEARDTLVELVRPEVLDAAPMDSEWPPAMIYLAGASVQLRHPSAAEILARRLAPLVGRDATFVGLVHFGSYGHHLGRLAEVCDRLDEAVVHLSAAVDHYDQAGLKGWGSVAREDLARTARRRPHVGGVSVAAPA